MLTLSGFRTAKGFKLSQENLLKEIVDFILENKNYKYKILVGTDSENQRDKIEFISVIVVHRVGYGARYFWKKQYLPYLDFHSRLWQEAIFSLEISKELLKKLLDKTVDFYFEVHLDIGDNGKSKSVISELINLIRGHGFQVKVKPESYAASKIADHLL